MTKKFLVSVANVFGYDQENGDLVFVGKTLLDSSIETALNATDVRGGRGNQLQYVYYNGADMTIAVNDAQFNLDFLAKNVGSAVATSNNIWTEETVVLDAGSEGDVTGTPIATPFTSVYGWVAFGDGTTQKVTFSATTHFAVSGHASETVCVRYYALDAASRSLTIPSNIIPSIVYLVMEAQLASADETANVIGKVQIIVPKATMTGAFSMSMTADGVASTPLNARALAYEETTTGACTNAPYLAKIIEILDTANWYDNVIALAISGGDFALTHPDTRLLQVWAIPSSGAAFLPPVADLTFASSTVGAATVDAAGLVTTVAAGTTTVKASITAVATIDANVIVTVS